MARPSYNIDEMSGLWMVKPKRNLFWPSFVRNEGNPRGGEGFVVDLDIPYEKEFCRGQEKYLIPAPPGAVADAPISWKPAVRWLKNNGYEIPEKPVPVTPQATQVQVLAENASAVAPPSEYPNLDEPPKRRGPGRPRKRPKEDSDG